jgi:hypothetical protein
MALSLENQKVEHVGAGFAVQVGDIHKTDISISIQYVIN